MKRRSFLISSMLLPFASTVLAADRQSDKEQRPLVADTVQDKAFDAMKRATRHMDQIVSYKGGYVWAYTPDLTSTWGEMEAKRTMCWIQPPGTPTVAHSFIDAYHATGDEIFYDAAVRTGLALIQAQHPSGGWNYIYDFAGEDSLKHWYDTIGRNGWRLEEFQHYYGNATFDDAGTAVSSQVLLRLYLEKNDKRFLAPLNKAIDFVIKSQFSGGIADGGWPQRWPHYENSTEEMLPPNPHQIPKGAYSGMEDGDYTKHITFNDDVAGENIKFLLMAMISLERKDLVQPIVRAMECLRRMQQPAPQAGWGLQHLAFDQNGRKAGAPAAARSYEPRALATHTTQTNIQQLFNYFTLTGDKKYLERIPEALAWLETCPLPENAAELNPLLKGRTHPTFIALETNEPRFVHRYGSNIHNGAYYIDGDISNTPSHYSSGRAIDIDGLRMRYDTLSSMSAKEIAKMVDRSPLHAKGAHPLPKYFSMKEVDFPDLFIGAVKATPTIAEADALKTIDDMKGENYWLSPLPAITNPYRGDGPQTAYTGTAYRSKHVGDVYDTSPYPADNPPDIAPYTKKIPPLGITTASFVENMGTLIAFVAPITK